MPSPRKHGGRPNAKPHLPLPATRTIFRFGDGHSNQPESADYERVLDAPLHLLSRNGEPIFSSNQHVTARNHGMLRIIYGITQ